MNTPSPVPNKSIPQTKPLVDAFLEDRQERELSCETIRWYRRYLTAFAKANKRLPAQAKVPAYLDTCAYSGINRDNALKAITTFYHWIAGTGDKNAPMPLPDNPAGRAARAFLESAKMRGTSAGTLRWYSGILARFCTACPELPHTPEPIESFIGNANSGSLRRHGIYRTLRAFFNWLTDRYGLTNNPMQTIRAPKKEWREKMPLSLDQLRQLLEYPLHPQEIRALLYLLADTGIRIGEALSIDSDGISPAAEGVLVEGKVGVRIVPVKEITKELLLALGADGKLFPRSGSYYQRMVSQAFKAAGVPGTAHTLRHTLASHWQGSDLALKNIGGWRSWSMVEHYSHRRFEKAKSEHDKHSLLTRLYSTQTPIDPDLSLPVRQILQIVPGSGWKAVFALQAASYTADGYAIPNIMRKPVICFGLVKNPDGTTDLRGFDAADVITDVDDVGNFLGYEAPNDDEDYSDQWWDWLKSSPGHLREVRPVKISAN